MTDPLRSEASAASVQPTERERDARVEELLLGGLDHYFAGHYDLAINVWTRVLFLDRGHARARAYIERARGAVAERQRQGDELVQTGADAFHRGESEIARRLLMSALEHGAGTEEAMSLLARLDRLAAASVKQEHRAELAPSEPVADIAPRDRAASRAWIKWTVAGAAIGAATVAIAIGLVSVPRNGWLPMGTTSVSRAGTHVNDEPLPVPSAADVWLARAQAQKDRGHLREALAALDAIQPGDKRGAEADKLRAEIQSALLAAGRAAAFGLSAPAEGGRR
jgi:hypothetical protein